MEGIPPDIWLYIFTFLDLKNLKNSTLICKEWNNVIKENSLWKCLFERDWSSININETKNANWMQKYMEKLSFGATWDTSHCIGATFEFIDQFTFSWTCTENSIPCVAKTAQPLEPLNDRGSVLYEMKIENGGKDSDIGIGVAYLPETLEQVTDEFFLKNSVLFQNKVLFQFGRRIEDSTYKINSTVAVMVNTLSNRVSFFIGRKQRPSIPLLSSKDIPPNCKLYGVVFFQEGKSEKVTILVGDVKKTKIRNNSIRKRVKERLTKQVEVNK